MYVVYVSEEDPNDAQNSSDILVDPYTYDYWNVSGLDGTALAGLLTSAARLLPR